MSTSRTWWANSSLTLGCRVGICSPAVPFQYQCNDGASTWRRCRRSSSTCTSRCQWRARTAPHQLRWWHPGRCAAAAGRCRRHPSDMPDSPLHMVRMWSRATQIHVASELGSLVRGAGQGNRVGGGAGCSDEIRRPSHSAAGRSAPQNTLSSAGTSVRINQTVAASRLCP